MSAGASRLLTRDDLRSLFEGATRSVFRMETLQVYDAPGEAERLQAFKAGLESWRRPADDESLRMIRETTTQGVAWSRVHVLERPLTDYLRFELAAYVENEAAGETVWIADRASHPGLADLREDFLLIDNQVGVLFRYDHSGRRLAWERIADDRLDRYRRHRDLALAHAVRLAHYHAFTATEG